MTCVDICCSTMEKQKKVTKLRGRTGGKFKQLNDGPKLPRSVRMAPGTGARNKNKIANLDELDMMHHAAIWCTTQHINRGRSSKVQNHEVALIQFFFNDYIRIHIVQAINNKPAAGSKEKQF